MPLPAMAPAQKSSCIKAPYLSRQLPMNVVSRVVLVTTLLSLLAGPGTGVGQMPESPGISRIQNTFSIPTVNQGRIGLARLEEPRPLSTGGYSERPGPDLFEIVEQERSRPWWRYPLLGLGIGATAGGLYGLYRDSRCGGEDNWVCGAYAVTYAGIGGVAGAITGLIANAGRRENTFLSRRLRPVEPLEDGALEQAQEALVSESLQEDEEPLHVGLPGEGRTWISSVW